MFIDRDIAEWFAVRSAEQNNGEAVVVTAKVRKAGVRLAKASEKEVVTVPRRSRYQMPSTFS
ncbi:hypothetical protein X773_31065 [Mesorhizobium sp. LSJC285A00]|nr:hypothetical protein X773_31065 [Mesorhizobium sp. LSJC285A00]